MAPAYFAEGTRLATDRGPVAIERLRVGDKVRTAWGELRPVQRIGCQPTDCVRHLLPHDVWPVRVSAHAFGHGRPWRDVSISPDHAIHVREVGGADRLIPANRLINDATITQEPVAEVTYWHVQLPEHDVVLAEGLACASDFAASPMAEIDAWAEWACADRMTDGPEFEAVRERLLARAGDLGFTLTSDAHLRVVCGGRDLPWYDGRMVLLPPGGAPVRLISRTAVPAHLRVADADHRRLGVAVTELQFDGVAVPLDDTRLGTGWYAPEPGWRWTDGAAELAVGPTLCLTIGIRPLVQYWVAPRLAGGVGITPR